MFQLLLNITAPEATQTCLWGAVCANETFIAIYGVIFTIVISLGVYIYGLQNKSERITLIKCTDIKGVITNCLVFFSISFFSIPSPFYEFVNFGLAAYLLLNIFSAFSEIFKFNESELSGEKAVKKFKEGVIREKLKQFEDLKIKSDAFNQRLEEKRGKEIERFLFNESNDSYYFIRSKKSGYITNIDLDILFTKEIDRDLTEAKEVVPDNPEYYIPYNISPGAPIDVDTIVLGIKKKPNQKIDEQKLRSFVAISEEYENPTSYIEAETRSYYPEMISLIKLDDVKSLELKLKDFSGLVNNFTKKSDSYIDIVQFINDDIIFPLQRYAFKHANVDCIKKVVSFSLKYIYQALDGKSIQTFNIFLRNLGHAFYESFSLSENDRTEFHDIYFRWLKEVAKYSIKSRLEKDSTYTEYAVNFLSSINGWLKIAFDNKDVESFEKMLSLLNEGFSRTNYERGENVILDEVNLIKKAVIFGFTAWAYKQYRARRYEEFHKNALTKLLITLENDSVYHRGNRQDDLNYLLSIYLKAADLSEGKGSFGWDSWGMPEGIAYTVTVGHDMKILLADRILSLISKNPALVIDVEDQNYNDELSLVKEGSREFDPLHSTDKDFFIATKDLTDEQFNDIKAKFYEIFAQITEKYETDVESKIMSQPIDDTKFDVFSKGNFESYEKSRTLYRIQEFTKNSDRKKDGFGYNTLLHKEQFVTETNVHYVSEHEFGENLARSEDNKILEEIHKKSVGVDYVSKDNLRKKISSENDLAAIVFWLGGYLSIEDIDSQNFKPYWQDVDSKENMGPYYQGSIEGVPVYIIYKFDEHKSYPDSLFLFKKNSFNIEEFEIEQDDDLDSENTKWAEDLKNCLTISITNLTDDEEARAEIVDNWIEKDPSSVSNREAKIAELRTNVIFKFYKGLSMETLTVDFSKLKIFHIK